jgi:hypothetical protein
MNFGKKKILKFFKNIQIFEKFSKKRTDWREPTIFKYDIKILLNKNILHKNL